MNKNDFIKLGRSIIAGRKVRHLSQEQLARKVDISPSGLSKIERGITNPSAFTVYKLIKILDIGLNWLK